MTKDSNVSRLEKDAEDRTDANFRDALETIKAVLDTGKSGTAKVVKALTADHQDDLVAMIKIAQSDPDSLNQVLRDAA
jgi:ABC-type transporter Mla subunit MlaD